MPLQLWEALFFVGGTPPPTPPHPTVGAFGGAHVGVGNGFESVRTSKFAVPLLKAFVKFVNSLRSDSTNFINNAEAQRTNWF